MDWQQSDAAKAKQVCHTKAECNQMYEAIPQEKKEPALKYLRTQLLAGDKDKLIAAINADPKGWYGPYHHGWGTAVRNELRQMGYGEGYFGVHNLDDIYIQLVTEALTGKPIFI